MDMTLSQALILSAGAMLAGIILLVKGGDWTVDSSVFVARKFGVSPLLVGFTIIAFGTSLPELIVSILANIENSPGIALGNVLGSNIANILFVIGVCAVFTPLVTTSKAVLKDLIMMLAATVLLAVLLFYGGIGRLAGLGMVVALIIYVSLQYKMAKSGEMPPPEEDESGFSNPAQAYGFLAMGLVGIALGAQFLVHGAKTSAVIIGVPDAVIGLSIIALGTSLPELSTSIIAGRKGHSDMVLGNIIGSNVFNILIILGLAAIVKPFVAGTFAPQLIDLDIWVVGLVSFLFAGLLLFYNRISKPVGLVFIAGYALYNIYIYGIYIGS